MKEFWKERLEVWKDRLGWWKAKLSLDIAFLFLLCVYCTSYIVTEKWVLLGLNFIPLAIWLISVLYTFKGIRNARLMVKSLEEVVKDG